MNKETFDSLSNLLRIIANIVQYICNAIAKEEFLVKQPTLELWVSMR